MQRLKLEFNGSDFSIDDVIISHRLEICDRIMTAVKEGISKNLDSVHIVDIKVNNTLYAVENRRETWVSSLKRCISHYENAELYEKCASCVKLIEETENFLIKA